MEGVTAFFGFRSLQMLEGVNGFDFGEKFVEPLDAGFGLAVLSVFDEVGDLVLANRTVADGIALEQRDFDLVVAGEQERLPLFFFAFFDGELEVGVFAANALREFIEEAGTLRLWKGRACNSPWTSPGRNEGYSSF